MAVGCCNKEFRKQLQDDDLWRMLAEQKWGRHVSALAQVQPGGWAAWTKHRLSASHSPLSPLDLVQEHYRDCPFQHITACLLCSRTTGGAVVRDAIRQFIELFPTPSAVLDASDDSMLEVLHPLGLQPVRLAAVRGLARDFLATGWQDPIEFKHCGPFVSHSWRIFCQGERSTAGVEDKNLRRYLYWLNHGQLDEEKRQQHGQQRGRKREAEKAAAPGTLRSGRRRDGDASSGSGAKRGRQDVGCGERRVTRAAAAAAGGCAAKPAKGRRH